MELRIPQALKKEHEALSAKLSQATREPGPLGAAARQLACRLQPHLAKEEECALPPLALLPALAHGQMRGEMAEVLPLIGRLESMLDTMLEEHDEIALALDKFRVAARDAGRPEYATFADALVLRTHTAEQVLYPAVLLIGKHLAAQQQQLHREAA